MTMIKYDFNHTLSALVTRIAETKLKIAEVRRRKAARYNHPDFSALPVEACVGVSHFHMLDSILENLDLDSNFGELLEPVSGSPGRFKASDTSLARKEAEIEGTATFRSLFELLIVLDELIDRINELFDQADNAIEQERIRQQNAIADAEDLRLEACRRK